MPLYLCCPLYCKPGGPQQYREVLYREGIGRDIYLVSGEMLLSCLLPIILHCMHSTTPTLCRDISFSFKHETVLYQGCMMRMILALEAVMGQCGRVAT